MTLSVCVPAYNAARTLEDTLDSILRNDADFELVVLNNASCDATEEIARSRNDPRVVVHSNRAVLSIGDNWNKAVSLSHGHLVKVVCADDLIDADAIAEQSSIMADPSIALSASRFNVIDEAGGIEEADLGPTDLAGRADAQAVLRTVVRDGPAGFGPTAGAIFRRTHFERVGGFRGDLVFPMDVDLFARVVSFGHFFGGSKVLASWRNSSFNLCTQTTSRSKLTEMYRCNRRLRSEFPELVSATDVMYGDLRLLNSGLGRISARFSRLVGHVA